MKDVSIADFLPEIIDTTVIKKSKKKKEDVDESLEIGEMLTEDGQFKNKYKEYSKV